MFHSIGEMEDNTAMTRCLHPFWRLRKKDHLVTCALCEKVLGDEVEGVITLR